MCFMQNFRIRAFRGQGRGEGWQGFHIWGGSFTCHREAADKLDYQSRDLEINHPLLQSFG